jgi:GT2 family glycosyltransferase
MPDLPRITVVTPSYNQAAFLEQTLLSVLSQGYPDLEYLVLDGGSTDGSRKIIRKYSGKITWWKSSKDKGQSDAIAQGFRRATGEVLCWLNSDDVFLPGALECVGRHFRSHPQSEAVCGGAYFIDAQGQPLRQGFLGFNLGAALSYDLLRFYNNYDMLQPSVFWRREAYWEAGGLDTGLHFAMDRDFFTRLTRRRPMERIPRLLAAARVHPDTKSMRLQEVHRRETLLLSQRYGVDQEPAWKRSLGYWRYRIPSLGRKLDWAVRRSVGLVRLQPVHYEPL